MRFPSALSGKSSAIRSAARLERGVHSPRRIASAKRVGGLAQRRRVGRLHEISHRSSSR